VEIDNFASLLTYFPLKIAKGTILVLDSTIVGVTGSFGSGCSTLCKVLKELGEDYDLKVENFKIRSEIEEEATNRSISSPDRGTLQDIGNEFREKQGRDYWAKRILSKIEDSTCNFFIVDGIKNLGEVQGFHKHPRFFLIAVDCSIENRWDRLKAHDAYKDNRRSFEDHDRRDKDEGFPHGQQVLRCVEHADIIFTNEEQFPTELRIKDEIKNRFHDNLKLITGKQLRRPNIKETMMAVACNLALQSRCLKRRVGAVLCSKDGFIVSAAYNEVPYPGKSCHEVYRMCYRDYFRNGLKEKLVKSFDYCPKCARKLEAQQLGADFICPSCRFTLTEVFRTVKALDKCRSLHAEEVVLLRAPEFQINGSTLYTTTFPCLQCAKRIIHAHLKDVIYIDPYPEEEAIQLLEEGGVKTVKFSGVKAQAFYRFFYPYREWLEKQIEERLEDVHAGRQ